MIEQILYVDEGVKIFRVKHIGELQLQNLMDKIPKRKEKKQQFYIHRQKLEHHYRDIEIVISHWNDQKKLEEETVTLKLPESVLLLLTQLSQQLKHRGIKELEYWVINKRKYVTSVSFMSEAQMHAYKELNLMYMSQRIYWHENGKEVNEKDFKEWFK